MPLYGYARVSTLDRDLSIQHAALKAAALLDAVMGLRQEYLAGRLSLRVMV